LQNCYPLTDWKVQKIGLGLVLTEHFLKEVGAGCCRVHGGGFAGVIQTMVRTSDLDAYVEYMSKYFGKENVYPMNVRNTGAVHVE
ncbi:MAG: galactokinase, partial [Lachnospiraceae bacterium]|nr:galactokinase [Lachnospiraceae bacterium]